MDGHISSWISQDEIDEYNERATCFVDQFNNYTLDLQYEDGEPVQVILVRFIKFYKIYI